MVIKRQGHGARETFTVRKQSFGVGVERTFPVHSPKIEKIEVAARGDVRRAKLYYLRDRVGKRARVRERRYTGPEEIVEPGLLHDPAAQLEAEAAADAEAPSTPRRVDDGEDARRGRRRAETTAERAGRRGAEARDAAEADEPRPTLQPTSSRARAAGDEPRSEKSAGGSVVELVVIVAVALGLALGIQAFLVKPYRIPSESMVPTLQIGQRVLVNRIGNALQRPDVGEIVVFHPPDGRRAGNTCGRRRARRPARPCDEPTPTGAERQLHQARRRRPGRHDLHRRRPRRSVNGKRAEGRLHRARAAAATGCNFPTPITIPAGHYS